MCGGFISRGKAKKGIAGGYFSHDAVIEANTITPAK